MVTREMQRKRQEESRNTEKKMLFCCLFLVLVFGGILAVLAVGGSSMGKLRYKDGYYEIWSKEDYRRFWEMAGRQSDCNGRLMRDITINDREDIENWREKIPDNQSLEVASFSGIFDGNGYTIYGIYSENGYGLVKDNLGTIKNLTIKNSLVTGRHSEYGDSHGGYYNSGICYRNYRQIQNCRFEGTLCDDEYHSARAAGICIINYGSIEGCVYKGSMQYIWYYWVYSDRAGICTENRGKVSNCGNLSEEEVSDKGYYTEKPEDCYAYPIADEGMENCYVMEDSAWGRLRKEPVIALSEEQRYALPWLLKEDFYPLLEKELELPLTSQKADGSEDGHMFDISLPNSYGSSSLRKAYKDPMIVSIIRLLAEHEDGILADMSLEEMEERQPWQHIDGDFAAELTVKDQTVTVEGYLLKELEAEIAAAEAELDAGIDWGADTDFAAKAVRGSGSDGNYKRLWICCSAVLGQKGIDIWEHKTYQLTRLSDRIGSCLDSFSAETGTETLVEYEMSGDQGFFYVSDDMLYRIKMPDQEYQEEDVLAERILKYITEEWQLSEGIQWNDRWIQKAVYDTLQEEGKGIVCASSGEKRAFANEEVTGLSELTVREVGNVESYQDLQILQSLTSLRLCGKEGGSRRRLFFYIDEGSLPKLEEVAIENCRIGKSLQTLEKLPALTGLRLEACSAINIDDLQRLPKLKKLSLKADGITDISEIAKMADLAELDLSFNEIEDFSPLYELKNLQSLAVNDNPGKELGDLVYVQDLWVGERLEKEEEIAAAQQALNEVYPDNCYQTEDGILYDIQVEDQARGDLNGDGTEDLAIIGFRRVTIDEEAELLYPLGRKLYLLLGTEQGFRLVQTIYLPRPVEERVGLMEGNPFCEVAISGNHLIVQIWSEEESGDGQSRMTGGVWKSISIYTWADGKVEPECRRETEELPFAEMSWEGMDEQEAEMEWKDDVVKRIVYRTLSRQIDNLSEDGMEQALEEIRELSIYEFAEVSTLADLKKMPNLQVLYLFGGTGKGMDLTKELVPNLKELIVSCVEMENADFLEKLPPLNRLCITGCSLEDISAIGCQRELTDVYLARNWIKNIWPLRGCRKIEKLTLGENWIEDISVLASLENLQELELSDNRIRNIEVLQWLPELRSLFLDHNQIQDISVLQNMEKLQILWLSDNRIEDFRPILGLKNLFSLSVDRNSGQNIGDLLFVPHFTLNGWFGKGEGVRRNEAQRYLNSFYAGKKLVAEDMVKGDLNGDGILDAAVVGSAQFEEDSGENGAEAVSYDIKRAIYVFLGQADGNSRALSPIVTSGSDEGGPFGDPYQGMMITEGRLAVQTYGGSSWRWGYLNVYEYENGSMVQKWELYRTHSTFASGDDFTVKDMETGHMWHYVIAGEWGEERQQLLLAECYDEAYKTAAGAKVIARYGDPLYAVAVQENKKWKDFSAKSGFVTPQLYADVYQPEICEEYYEYRLYTDLWETKVPADKVLDMAAEEFLQSENLIIGGCYPSEEIKHNFELLVGVELPVYFYMGYSRKGIPAVLCYDGCELEDGNYVHRLALMVSDGEYWKQREIITYEEAEGVFVVG